MVSKRTATVAEPIRAFRLFGHPLHVAFVHLPAGLLLLPLPLDLAGWMSNRAWCWEASRGCLIVGLAAAALATATGLLDYAAMRGSPRAQRAANRHMVVMLAAAAVFAGDLTLRLADVVPAGAWRVVAVGLSAGGAGLLAFGGWLGGELVYRHGVGQAGAEPSERGA